MRESNPLVERVDALLKRHQQQLVRAHESFRPEQAALPPLDLQGNPRTAEPADTGLPLVETDHPAPVEPNDGPTSIAASDLQPVDRPGAALLVDARPDRPHTESEDDIPVLIEIVDPAAIVTSAPGLENETLLQELEAALLAKLLAELDRALDQRLGRTIGDLLEQVMHGLRAELSVGVRQMVREAVAAAVAKEIAARQRAARQRPD